MSSISIQSHLVSCHRVDKVVITDDEKPPAESDIDLAHDMFNTLENNHLPLYSSEMNYNAANQFDHLAEMLIANITWYQGKSEFMKCIAIQGLNLSSLHDVLRANEVSRNSSPEYQPEICLTLFKQVSTKAQLKESLKDQLGALIDEIDLTQLFSLMKFVEENDVATLKHHYVCDVTSVYNQIIDAVMIEGMKNARFLETMHFFYDAVGESQNYKPIYSSDSDSEKQSDSGKNFYQTEDIRSRKWLESEYKIKYLNYQMIVALNQVTNTLRNLLLARGDWESYDDQQYSPPDNENEQVALPALPRREKFLFARNNAVRNHSRMQMLWTGYMFYGTNMQAIVNLMTDFKFAMFLISSYLDLSSVHSKSWDERMLTRYGRGELPEINSSKDINQLIETLKSDLKPFNDDIRRFRAQHGVATRERYINYSGLYDVDITPDAVLVKLDENYENKSFLETFNKLMRGPKSG